MIYTKARTVISNFYSLIILLAITSILYSCKKEYPDLPYNDIEQFTIKDADGNTLKASAQGTDLIVYYPPFLAVPDTIAPSIVVSEGATVEPASGAKVPFKTGIAFKVKAADGSVKNYILKALVNAPAPVFSVGDTRLDDILNIFGEYFIPDTATTKLFLVTNGGKDIQVPGSTFITFNASHLIAPLPPAVDTGYYKVKVISGAQSVIQGPIHIDRPSLVLSIPQATVKRGEDITIVAGPNTIKYWKNDIGGQVQINYGRRDFVEVAFTSISNTEMKVKVPSNFPNATISGITIDVGYPIFITPDAGQITVAD